LARADLGTPFRELDLSHRPFALRAPLEQVRRGRETVELSGVGWSDEQGVTRVFDVCLEPVPESGDAFAIRIRFEDVTRAQTVFSELTRSHRELEVAYEEIQSTREELHTTTEELQSMLEELETANDELQSSNEELETMNAELQSLNVELETVNHALQQRTAERDEAGRYVSTILDSLQTALVVMDLQYRVRFWNEGAAKLWGRTPEEVVGRSFLRLEIGLPVQELRETLRRCLKGEEDLDARLDGHDHRGNPLIQHVRCVPLLDGEVERRILGAIVMVEAGDGR
jgi:two-component system CheB/CheR fusion protein